MPVRQSKTHFVFMSVILFFLLPGFLMAEGETTNLQFEFPPSAGSNAERTLQSLVKIQGTGQFREDGLYLMTHFGDREKIFQKENQSMIDNPLLNQTWRFCSLFSASSEGSVIMGRNWDNQNVGSIIISLYNPEEGYSSVSFTRSISLGFGHKDLEPFTSGDYGKKLLAAPFYAFDGINDQGLAVGVAGVNQVTLQPNPDKELVYVPFLVRKILDQARNVEEAVALVEKYIPFDLDASSLNAHYFVVDASGKSVVLEYTGDRWERTFGGKNWQVMTTRPVFNVQDEILRSKCWRYRSLCENLEGSKGVVDWQSGLRFLQDAAQTGTTWSVVYSPSERDLFFSVYQEWDKVYYFRMRR